jgi:hypothetical protein
MQTLIKFTGHISLDGQDNGLPPEIYTFLTLQDASEGGALRAIAEQFNTFRSMGGMIVEKDQGAPINLKVSWLSRMYVPYNWIVKITVGFSNLTQEITVPDTKGVERFSDGTEAVKQ